MTETMLVRAAGGGWEELRPQTTLPEGGLVDMFGEDVGPVLGTAAPVLVAACAPALSTGAPDAVCVDADGGIWLVQLALEDEASQVLPQLLAAGGALASTSYDAFEALCDRTRDDTLAAFVEARCGAGFHRQSFEVTVADALAHGRFRLVAIVGQAPETLVQSMRFLNATGAMGRLYEATSFASESVTAVHARQVDVGGSSASTAAPSGDAGAAAAPPSLGAAGFVAATGKASGDATGALMAQLQKACAATFDETVYEGVAAQAQMRALITTPKGLVPMLVAGTDGSVMVSFEALATLDTGWSAREELCQGMERLLGADLGDVRKISQLNLTIDEHLMDATLMEALGELLADTVTLTRDKAGARQSAAA
jgi:hypothetical protein